MHLEFSELLVRVRNGDPAAAEQLLRDYGAAVRRVVRVRLTSPALRRQLDSMDICQSVMLRFFVSMGLGKLEIASPDDLISLLATIAQNRIREIARTQQAARRDVRRLDPADIGDLSVAQLSPSPSELVCDRDLLETVRQRLSGRDRYLVDQRMQDRSWIDIGREMGVRPDTLRIAFSRAIDRVVSQLGFH